MTPDQFQIEQELYLEAFGRFSRAKVALAKWHPDAFRAIGFTNEEEVFALVEASRNESMRLKQEGFDRFNENRVKH